MPAKGDVPICESPRDAAILELLPPSAHRGSAAGRRVVRAAWAGFAASVAAPEEGRSPLVNSGRDDARDHPPCSIIFLASASS